MWTVWKQVMNMLGCCCAQTYHEHVSCCRTQKTYEKHVLLPRRWTRSTTSSRRRATRSTTPMRSADLDCFGLLSQVQKSSFNENLQRETSIVLQAVIRHWLSNVTVVLFRTRRAPTSTSPTSLHRPPPMRHAADELSVSVDSLSANRMRCFTNRARG